MVLLPQETIEQKINNLIEKDDIQEYYRDYIGYSTLGGPCKRAIWYSFRWCKLNSTSKRIKRLFARGDREEEIIINDLERIGINVFGCQKTVKGLAGHVFGHIDGLADNVPFLKSDEIVLLELKTANQKNFDKFKKDDDVQKTNNQYYHQAQSYMGKLKLNKTLFIVTNKNTEERWIKIIEFDDLAYSKAEHIAFEILSTDVPPEKIGNSTWYQCKYCNFKDICHFKKKILKSCRSCQNCIIEDEGVFKCNLNDKILSIEEQKKACDQYVLLETLKKGSIFV